jgi:hypothetical protein
MDHNKNSRRLSKRTETFTFLDLAGNPGLSEKVKEDPTTAN